MLTCNLGEDVLQVGAGYFDLIQVVMLPNMKLLKVQV